ncbi:nucleotide-binding alpha-beta plait domain-containing protein [Tanacetum coccineum]
MGAYRTKEDDVAKISTSIYVTNFPESIKAKELFQACKGYGHVVDSFIPNKRAKNGKRFGFVRFINVFDVQRLVGNLETVWIDRHKLQANVAWFQRSKVNSSFSEGKTFGGNKTNKMETFNSVKVNAKNNGFNGEGNFNFVSAVKGVVQSGDVESKSQGAMILDDECLVSRDLSKALMCRVKVFASLANLRVTLKNEGFSDVKIRYLGEYWVMLEFASTETMMKFQDCGSIGSWFSAIKNASLEFQLTKRIAWVEMEGIPFKLWSSKTFGRIANKWGDLLDVDDEDDNCFHSKRLCIHTKMDRSISDEFKIIYRGLTFWVRANKVPGWVPDFNDDSDEEDQDDNNGYDDEGKIREPDAFRDESDDEKVPETLIQDDDQDAKHMEEGETPMNDQSEDPFNIYPLLNKNDKKDMKVNESDNSLEYPSGFSPKENQDENSFNGGGERQDMDNATGTNDTVLKCKIKKQVYEASNVSASSGHFKLSERPRTGGSILDLLDEVVKVGQVMGYKMEGCVSNIAEIIETQGAKEVVR